MKREQKLNNQKFIIKSRYSERAIKIALCGWSTFKGPCYDKIWFKPEFELACFCANEGLKLVSYETEAEFYEMRALSPEEIKELYEKRK